MDDTTAVGGKRRRGRPCLTPEEARRMVALRWQKYTDPAARRKHALQGAITAGETARRRLEELLAAEGSQGGGVDG